MSLPTAEQNGVFTHVYPVTDLGMATVIGNDASSTGTNFSTGCPATVLVLCSLVSGGGSADIDVNDGTATLDSPDKVLVLSGTGRHVEWVNTAITYDDSDTRTTTISSNQLYVGLRLRAGSSGMQVNEFAVLVLYELTAGEDWFLGIRSSANAVANRTVGGNATDGSGVVSMSPTAPAVNIKL